MTLLPPNATAQERAVESVIERVSAVPVPVREVWNPDTCPVELLPWLAWAFSLDEWNPDWSEQQKREAIRAAFYVHQRKGTAGAVRRALGALGYDARLVEWFEMDPPGEPYTFEIHVEFTGLPLEAAVLDEAERIARATKNVRSHLARARGISRLSGSLVVGAANMGGEVVDILPFRLTLLETTARAAVGGTAAQYEIVSIYPGE